MPSVLSFTIPSVGPEMRQHGILLDQLDLSLHPAYLQTLQVAVAPDVHAKSIIMEAAIDLNHHEKRAGIWRRTAKEGRNQLVWFMKRIYRTNGTSNPQSNALWRLRDLAEFEDIYHMTCAKLRELYEDLYVRFYNGFITFETVMHQNGDGATTTGPFTAGQMLDMLLLHWESLQDPEIVKALDTAVRASNFLKFNASVLGLPSYDLILPMPDREKSVARAMLAEIRQGNMVALQQVPGLMNSNAMSPSMVVAAIWEKYRNVIDPHEMTSGEVEIWRNDFRTKLAQALENSTITFSPESSPGNSVAGSPEVSASAPRLAPVVKQEHETPTKASSKMTAIPMVNTSMHVSPLQRMAYRLSTLATTPTRARQAALARLEGGSDFRDNPDFIRAFASRCQCSRVCVCRRVCSESPRSTCRCHTSAGLHKDININQLRMEIMNECEDEDINLEALSNEFGKAKAERAWERAMRGIEQSINVVGLGIDINVGLAGVDYRGFGV